jgi:hypothetical protein
MLAASDHWPKMERSLHYEIALERIETCVLIFKRALIFNVDQPLNPADIKPRSKPNGLYIATSSLRIQRYGATH